MAVAEGDASRRSCPPASCPGSSSGRASAIESTGSPPDGSGGSARFSRQVAQGQALRSSPNVDLALLAVAPARCSSRSPSRSSSLVGRRFHQVSMPAAGLLLQFLPARPTADRLRPPCCSATGRAARALRARAPAPRSAPARKSCRARRRCPASARCSASSSGEQLAVRDRHRRHALVAAAVVGDAPHPHAGSSRQAREQPRAQLPLVLADRRRTPRSAPARRSRVGLEAVRPRSARYSIAASTPAMPSWFCVPVIQLSGSVSAAGPHLVGRQRLQQLAPAPQNAHVRAEELVGRAGQKVAIPSLRRRSARAARSAPRREDLAADLVRPAADLGHRD